MFGKLLQIIGLKRKPPRRHPLVERMIEKDAELFDEIGPLPLKAGAIRWKEKYPEDFPEIDLKS